MVTLQSLLYLVSLSFVALSFGLQQQVALEYDLCEEIIIEGQIIFLRLSAEETPSAWSKRYLAEYYQNASSTSTTISYQTNVELLTAFVEHRIRLVQVRRMEIRRYLTHFARQPMRLIITNQDCQGMITSDASKEKRGREENLALFLTLPMSLMNAWRESDWTFYFADAPPSYIRLESDVVAKMMQDTSSGRYKRMIDLSIAFLGNDGILELALPPHDSDPLKALQASLQEDILNRFPTIIMPLDNAGRNLSFRKTAKTISNSNTRLLGLEAIYVINLDRRPDRWSHLQAHASATLSLPAGSFTRVQATDGDQLDPSEEILLRIFNLSKWRSDLSKNPHQDHGYQPHVLGCALSHIRIWESIASMQDAGPNDAFLILEDDVIFEKDFLVRWKTLWPTALEHDWTWRALWLGYLDAGIDIYGDRDVHEGVRHFNGGVSRTFGAGAYAYVLRKKGAVELMDAVWSHGVQQAIDWFLFDRFDEMVCYYVHPPIIQAPAGIGRDSDVSCQEYPQTRLLLQKQAQEGKTAPSLLLTISSPTRGSVFAPGDRISLQVLWESQEDTRLTFERHRDSRLCLQVSPSSVSDLGEQSCYSTLSSIHLDVPKNVVSRGSLKSQLTVSLANVMNEVVALSQTFFYIRAPEDDGNTEGGNATTSSSLYDRARAYCFDQQKEGEGSRRSIRLCMLDMIDGMK